MDAPIHRIDESCEPIDSKDEQCQQITCDLVSIAGRYFMQLIEGLHHQIDYTSCDRVQAADKELDCVYKSSKGHNSDAHTTIERHHSALKITVRWIGKYPEW